MQTCTEKFHLQASWLRFYLKHRSFVSITISAISMRGKEFTHQLTCYLATSTHQCVVVLIVQHEQGVFQEGHCIATFSTLYESIHTHKTITMTGYRYRQLHVDMSRVETFLLHSGGCVLAPVTKEDVEVLLKSKVLCSPCPSFC